MHRRRIIAMLLLGAVAGVVDAQVDSVPRGAPVRAYLNRLPGEAQTSTLPRIAGTLAGMRRDTIFVIDGSTRDTAWVPLRNLDHLDYSTGQYHPVAKATFVGGLLGTFLGGSAGFFRTSGACTTDCYNGSLGGGQSKLRYTLVGTGIGLAGGLLTGALLTVERWHRAEIATP